MTTVNIASKIIDRSKSDYFVIAEIGVNHEGDVELAKKLIELAKEGGAHAAKFQAYKAGTLASRNSPAYWDTTKESTRTQFELFKKYDKFGETEYQELARHCNKVGIAFMCTAFDSHFVEILDPMVPAHKVASADLTNVPLLRKVGATGKPVLLSTGASNVVEICGAVETLRRAGCSDVSLLHCVLNYPTPDNFAFLARILLLRKLFPNLVIGYSDHTFPHDSCFPVVLAYALGARIIEKHFTHDKSLPGNDHYHAMDVNDLRGLISQLERASSLIGSDDERLFLSIQEPAIRNARRSIVISGNVSKGEILNSNNLTVKRPGHGVSPLHWDNIVGRTATRDLNDDHILSWRDIED